MLPRFTVLCLVAVLLPTVEVRLAGPLTTTIDLVAEFPAQASELVAQIEVPAGAPPDLQAGAFASGDDGGWRQSRFVSLAPGRNRVVLAVPAGPAGARAIGGLLFCSAATGGGRLRVDEVAVRPATATGRCRLLDLAWDGASGPDRAQAVAGRPWLLRLRPERSAGFALTGRAVAADGAIARLAAVPPAGAGAWTLRFTPPHAGTWRIEVEGGWGGEAQALRVQLDVQDAAAATAAVAQPSPDPTAPDGRELRLAAPLRTCLGEPVADASAACRISARLHLAADAPDDLGVGAFVRDGDGRWRQSVAGRTLRRGDNAVEFLVPAGGAAGAGEAGLVLWSAQPGRAGVRLLGMQVAPAAPPAGEPCLDRLRIDGVEHGAGVLRVAVGATWSIAVTPSPAAGEGGLAVAVSARITDAAGQAGEVAAVADPDGTQRIALHPSLPGTCTVQLLGRWSDGRQVACQLPRIEVTGEHPCRDGTVLALRAPLSTPLPVPLAAVGAANRITATVLVPDGAPADLAVGVAAIDRHDRWYQPLRRQPLRPGVNRLDLAIDRRSALAGAPGAGAWSEAAQAQLDRSALVFTTASARPPRLLVGQVRAQPAPPGDPARGRRLLAVSAPADGRTGERWRLTLRPVPFPANPYDPEEFRLDLAVATPEGARLLLPAFYAEDMAASDRGDRERLRSRGTGGFEVRYRPRTPGQHRLLLQAAWSGGGGLRCELPPLAVAGAPWDGFVRVDAQDPRFFAVAGRAYWPSGPNLRSVWDLRARERMHTRLTPDRGSLAYLAYLRRFAAAGANACEIWMSAWNLALEWRRDWPGFDGVGRYNQENAWRLDRILDAAWAEGMRVNLVINNHGQGSDGCDAEWANNPYNRAAGGRLTAAIQLFQDPWALRGQEQLRRYIIGRYADHPAVLGWKLWTEMNLTNGRQALLPWHEQAVRRWHELDPYGHPVASHWSGDYRCPNHAIARLLDYVCIDAYHDDKPENPYRLVHRLLRDSTLGADRGLAVLGRPVLVTEYGGNWSGTRNDALMQVDHASGAWAAFVSGHAGAPMLWWFEWVDQGGRWAPYGAIARFAAGDDLRGGGAAEVRCEPAARLWPAAWRTSQRLFGYVIDEDWAGDGGRARPVDAQIVIDGWPAGDVVCEWWDADEGRVIASRRQSHPGGSLRLSPPTFRRHLAWKLVRP